MKLDLVETARQLVAIKSVNPMGNEAQGDEFLEGRLTRYLETLFERLGLRHCRQAVLPGRENIVARLDGDVRPEDGGRVILFDAHQDTVRAEGMVIEPWNPLLRDGRLYGRGSCDTKGAMAAMIAAVARLAEELPAGMPTVMIACAVDEEQAMSGMKRLPELWSDEALGRADSIFPCRPHAAIVGEPTGLQIVVAHKGTVRWRCHTRGVAAHSAMPDHGQNAIYRMAEVLPLYARYQDEGVADAPSHALCGGASLNVGLIQGGTSVNTVPDLCTVVIDLRVPPSEDPRDAYRHVVDFIAKNSSLGFPIEHDEPHIVLRSMSDDKNGPISDMLLDATRQVVAGREKIGAVYTTHAAQYAAADVPAVVFGPGFIEQAHTVDEWLPLAQLQQAAEILYRFALETGRLPV